MKLTTSQKNALAERISGKCSDKFDELFEDYRKTYKFTKSESQLLKDIERYNILCEEINSLYKKYPNYSYYGSPIRFYNIDPINAEKAKDIITKESFKANHHIAGLNDILQEIEIATIDPNFNIDALIEYFVNNI